MKKHDNRTIESAVGRGIHRAAGGMGLAVFAARLRAGVDGAKFAQCFTVGESEQSPWGCKFPTIVAAWRRAWDRVIPFFAFPSVLRKVIYTTNAIESTNAQLRKIIKTRGRL